MSKMSKSIANATHLQKCKGVVHLPEYTAWLKQQLCCSCGAPADDGHHCGAFGSAKRNHDDWQIPSCRVCHTQMENYSHRYDRNKQRELAVEYYNKWLKETGRL